MRALGTWPLLVAAACSAAIAEEAPTGDPRKIEFVLPFEKALETAKAQQRLVFLKPIYGGVDQAGAADYRCGSW